MDEIAGRADVARATVFNHFPRKEAFLTADLDQRRERLSAVIADEAAEGVDADTRLYNAFDLIARFNEAAPSEARELIGAWWRTGRSQVTDPNTGWVFASLVRDGQQRGEFRSDLDPQAVGYLLLDAYVGTMLRWISGDPPPFSLRAALRDVCTTVLGGLRATAPEEPPASNPWPRRDTGTDTGIPAYQASSAHRPAVPRDATPPIGVVVPASGDGV